MSIAFALSLFATAGATAAAQRTFVASTGNDANVCSLTLPCRGFAAAVARTTSGGEVIVLDSAGYGPVTITQSVSIIAPSGIYAGISVFGGAGVTVNGSGISVALRGLSISGQGGVTTTGIGLQQGSMLTVDDCTITDMGAQGVFLGAPDSHVTIRNVVLRRTFEGVFASVDGSMTVTVASSVFEENGVGAWLQSVGGSVTLTVTRSIFTRNGIALQVDAVGAGQVASIFADGNTIAFSTVAAFYFDNGGGAETIFSPGNNAAGYINGPVVGGTLTSCCAL